MTPGREAPPTRGRIVIFDDESVMGRILVKTLGLEGFDAKAFTNPLEGLEIMDQLQPDVLLTDVRMPEMDGLQVLERMRRDYPDVPVLVLTAFGTIEGAVSAMQLGAFNYITKPFQHGNLVAQILRAMEHRRVLQENVRLSEQLSEVNQPRHIIGHSQPIQAVRGMIERAAPTDSSVLITGKSGVGKELVARAIHQQSRRAKERFVAINCPSIPSSLIESEMFGHERGAFTGADRSKMGLVELAQGGTLFLDEIAELPLEMQVKLLRVIQEREIQRVGGLKLIPVDLRLIAATNRDLQEEMAAGRFREDLFYRLNVVHLHIPSLAERTSDILELAEHFLDRIGRRMQRHGLRLSAGAQAKLQAYHWPGNIRELENVIERALVLSGTSVIEENELMINLNGEGGHNGHNGHVAPPPAPQLAQSAAAAQQIRWSIDYREARDQFEREYLLSLIEQAGGNMTRASQISGISRRNLYEKLEKVGLSEDLIKKR